MLPLHDLQKFGLTDKEAAAYVAALGLGSASVQEIARAARVKRPTAYLAIEALVHKGLMSSIEQEGRRFFVAESPERLASLYASWANELATKEQTLKQLLPELLALTAGAEEKPRVLFYQGLEGLETMREIFLKTSAKEMVSAVALDEYRSTVPRALIDRQMERIRELGIGGRVIYTSRGVMRPVARWQARRVPGTQFPFAGEMSALGTRTAIISYEREPIGVIVQSSRIVQMVKAVFELAWETARNYQ